MTLLTDNSTTDFNKELKAIANIPFAIEARNGKIIRIEYDDSTLNALTKTNIINYLTAKNSSLVLK